MPNQLNAFSPVSWRLVSLLALSLASACGSNNPSEPLVLEPEGELTEVACESSADCNDGVFCNGTESCDGGYCRLGVTPRCDDGIECTQDVCSHKTSSCQFTAPDEDGDGHADASCTGPDDEALGDDCDDEDPDRYPGNAEICSPDAPGHDEDCDPKSYGYQDVDADGEISGTCCNEDAEGELSCGPDCDDDDYRRNGDYPEICDDIDNDCDGKVDKNTKEVLWYPDDDGDHFGTESDDAILSCAPIEGRSLRDSDCDDVESAVHIAAREECDGLDNDCDGDTDEGGVCACAPQGNVRPCSCGGSATGVQQCDGGLWNSCDCSECVTGEVDCVGELLPRECVAGRWQVQPACRGDRPICLEGSCKCADGSDDCAEVPDILRPYVRDHFPLDGTMDVALESSLAIEFNEDIVLASATEGILLTDLLGAPLSGTVSVSGSTLFFVPDAPLSAGQTYQFQAHATITDLAGNALVPHTPILFRTASGLTAQRVAQDLQRNFSEPVLAVNGDGDAMLLLKSSPKPGFMGAPPSIVTMIWQETKFLNANLFWPDGAILDIAHDDQNRFIIGSLGSGEYAVYFFSGGVYVEGQVHSSNGNHTSTQVFANSAGSAFSIFGKDDRLQLAPGTTTWPLGTPVEFPYSPLDVQYVTGDLNAIGRGIIAFTDAFDSHAYLSDAALGNWQKAATNGGPDPAIHAVADVQVVLGIDNAATFAWTQSVSQSGQGNARQVFTQRLGSDGNWIGAPVQPSGAFHPAEESSLRLTSDATGNAMLSYTRGKQIVATRLPTGGNWSAETIFNAPTDLALMDPTLKMAANGEAVLGYIAVASKPNTYDLWVARYSPGTGWTPARLVEDDVALVTSFDLGIDSTGEVLVVYATTENDAVWVKL